MVQDIQRKLEEDAARPDPGLARRLLRARADVKNLVPHSVVYNCGRMQEVWLDK